MSSYFVVVLPCKVADSNSLIPTFLEDIVNFWSVKLSKMLSGAYLRADRKNHGLESAWESLGK
jgi:hypothetical protein